MCCNLELYFGVRPGIVHTGWSLHKTKRAPCFGDSCLRTLGFSSWKMWQSQKRLERCCHLRFFFFPKMETHENPSFFWCQFIYFLRAKKQRKKWMNSFWVKILQSKAKLRSVIYNLLVLAFWFARYFFDQTKIGTPQGSVFGTLLVSLFEQGPFC